MKREPVNGLPYIVRYPIKRRDETQTSIDLYVASEGPKPDPKQLHRIFNRLIRKKLLPGERTSGKTGEVLVEPDYIRVSGEPCKTKAAPGISVFEAVRFEPQ